MKNILKTSAIAFVIMMLSGTLNVTLADGPPPPPTGGGGGGSDAGHNQGGNQGAPIDGGLGILLAMGVAYGGKKLYQARKEKNKEAEENPPAV